MPRIPSQRPIVSPSASAAGEGAPPQTAAAEGLPASMTPRPIPATGYEAHFERGRYATLATVDGRDAVPLKATHDFRGPAFFAEAGKPLTVVARPDMFAAAQKVDLVYRLPGETEARRVPISDGSRDLRTGALVCLPATLDLPDDVSGTVRISFETTSESGRTSTQWSPHYDAIVIPKGGATLVFDEQWGESVQGRVQGGEKLQLAYDVDRAKGMLASSGAPRVTACVSFDCGPPMELPVSLASEDGAPEHGMAFLPAVRVPYDAGRVTVWFRAEGEGKARFDSDFGRNYSFDVGLPQADADPSWKVQALRIRGLPRLTEDNFVGIGPGDDGYNCIAWSLGLRDSWVWPGARVKDFDRLYAEQGYRPLGEVDLSHETGVEKIALYGLPIRGGADIEVTHAARNDEEGRWMSKLGTEPLIRHDDAAVVGGPSYGEVVRVYARPRPQGGVS